MKTAATAVVWRRVLLACLLCALWSEGRATEFSSRSSSDVDLQQKAEGADGLGQMAAEAQTTAMGSADGILKVMGVVEEISQRVKDAEGDVVVEAKDALSEVGRARRPAESLSGAAQEVTAAVRRALEESSAVEEAARELRGRAEEDVGLKEKMVAVKRRADGAAELWTAALKSAESQSSHAEKILEHFNAAKMKAEAAVGKLEAASEDYENKQKVLKEFNDTLTKATVDVGILHRKTKEAENKIREATSQARTLAASGADVLVNAAEETVKDKKGDPRTPQNSPGGAQNLPGSDGRETTATGPTTQDELNKDSSFDGSPLTVSSLAATSVLLLFARVAAMITA